MFKIIIIVYTKLGFENIRFFLIYHVIVLLHEYIFFYIIYNIYFILCNIQETCSSFFFSYKTMKIQKINSFINNHR